MGVVVERSPLLAVLWTRAEQVETVRWAGELVRPARRTGSRPRAPSFRRLDPDRARPVASVDRSTDQRHALRCETPWSTRAAPAAPPN